MQPLLRSLSLLGEAGVVQHIFDENAVALGGVCY